MDIIKIFLEICCLIVFSSLIFLPTSYTQCNTAIPDNSIVILDSNTYHTDTGGVIEPENIPGWVTGFNTDGIVYPVMTGGGTQDDTLLWRSPTLSTGACGPEYLSCFQSNLVSFGSVDTGEMNWLFSTYYEAEANSIHIKVKCTADMNYEQDCRKTFQIYYYESDMDISRNAAEFDALTSQYLPADNYADQLTDDVVLATFTKSKKGFYIGFLNSIPCALLTEILFYYFQCPDTESVSGVYSVSAVLSPSPTDVSVSADITCAPTYLRRDPLSLPAECYWNGTWRLPVESVCECIPGSYLLADNVCECMPGFHLLAENISTLSCVPCPANSYRAESGDAAQQCTLCPARSNTRGAEGAVECSCEPDWYRGEGEGVREPCAQSPSVARNVRVERGTASLTVEWDQPEYLGNRDASELRYRVTHYRTISPQMKSVFEQKERRLTFQVLESTEYVIVVTSLNNVSSVSGVYNRANLTVLSSFPDIISISYRESSYSLAWSYSLYGEREYVFGLSYTSAVSNETMHRNVSSRECECTAAYTCVCTVSIRDLDTQRGINITLFDGDAGALYSTNLEILTIESALSFDILFLALLALIGASCLLFAIPITILCIIFSLLWFVGRFSS